MTTFRDRLDKLTEAARTNSYKGTLFEQLIVNYFVADPQYADRLADVCLWSEWPEPTTIALLGIGLAGVGFSVRRN